MSTRHLSFRATTSLLRNLGRAILVGLAALTLVACERFVLDRRMEGLCKVDGGIHVYERVELPRAMFDQNGDPFPGWRARPAKERLGSEYELVHEMSVLKDGDPLRGEGKLMRSHWKVLRSVDHKVLGDAVVYGRSGGDFLVVDHFTSKGCPERLGAPVSLIHAIFVKGES
jgi:hypothetical protein